MSGIGLKIGAAIAASHVGFVFAAGIVRLRCACQGRAPSSRRLHLDNARSARKLRHLGNTKRIFEACRPGALLAGMVVMRRLRAVCPQSNVRPGIG